MEENYLRYAELIKEVAQKLGDERSSKCGYDLMMGLASVDAESNVEERLRAWRYVLDQDPENGLNEEERDGAWVPAISL